MRIINDGKFELVSISLFGSKIDINIWLTKESSSSLADNATLIVYVWDLSGKPNYKMASKKEYKLFKLK